MGHHGRAEAIDCEDSPRKEVAALSEKGPAAEVRRPQKCGGRTRKRGRGSALSDAAGLSFPGKGCGKQLKPPAVAGQRGVLRGLERGTPHDGVMIDAHFMGPRARIVGAMRLNVADVPARSGRLSARARWPVKIIRRSAVCTNQTPVDTEVLFTLCCTRPRQAQARRGLRLD